MPETVIPRAMLQGANETGDYFWDVWREPNDHTARDRKADRADFFFETSPQATAAVLDRS
ncbi:hypothetical protein SAMN04488557_4053 [Hyphomicrobium facile]|uniref:Uncharacterized protein n=1 Tax=Hyphomicrobium facile TaxID=51670 RepID=A0A1I7NWH9_9HYPH|nr:hypothetical protein SAMN04488557_4053 [Hyphomicrobium facile]